MISTHASTNAANAIMTNHSMSAFLEIVKETICNAVQLEDAAADNYNSNACLHCLTIDGLSARVYLEL